jgi:hypothetical protein
MQVATKKQIAKHAASDNFHIIPKSICAAESINVVLDNWGNMSADQCSQNADRLRALADFIDGRKTSGGNENRYSYR